MSIQRARNNVPRVSGNVPQDDLTILSKPGGEHLKQRDAVADSIRERHHNTVAQLIRIVESKCASERHSPKTLAAGALADLNALGAVPALTRNIEFQEPILILTIDEFHYDEYPCGDALRRMGRSALAPMLDEISKRDEPLSANGVNVVAYVIVAICGDSKVEALLAIQEAEQAQNGSETLHQVHMHIQHFMGLDKKIKRMKVDPKA